MEAPSTSVESASVASGLITPRGRGGTGVSTLRGSFERGRGRGINRGHYISSGNSVGYSSRNTYVGRGGISSAAMGHQNRGTFIGRGGTHIRGSSSTSSHSALLGRGGFISRGNAVVRGSSRMPLYAQSTKQHSGVDNNKTVSPLPNNTNNVSATDGTISEAVNTTVNQDQNAAISLGSALVTSLNAASNTTHSNYRGRGRGLPILRGGIMRGSHHVSMNNTSMHPMHIAEHNTVRRVGPSRGRGGYVGSSSMPRPSLHQSHPTSAQLASASSLKRGASGNLPGSKRGRYEGSSYSQRGQLPKYQISHHMQSAPQINYAISHQALPQMQSHHHAYLSHDPQQSMDPYSSSYAVSNPQSSYNGYVQSTGYPSHSVSVSLSQGNNGYAAHASAEYDQTQYHNFSASYGSQQDTRYQTYGQDYTQQYGAPAVDYNISQTDYTHPGQHNYDERVYGGYDSQSYHQSYTNSTGYY